MRMRKMGNANNLVSFDPNRFNEAEMKGIGGEFQIIYKFLWIYCNFSISSKITLFGGKIWVKYVIFSGRYVTNFLLAKSIHIWQLSLNIIELIAKSRVFENNWIFLKNKHLCEIWLINQTNAITQKLSCILKFWSLRVQLQSEVVQESTDNFFQIFPGNLFFRTLFSSCFFKT